MYETLHKEIKIIIQYSAFVICIPKRETIILNTYTRYFSNLPGFHHNKIKYQ